MVCIHAPHGEECQLRLARVIDHLGHLPPVVIKAPSRRDFAAVPHPSPQGGSAPPHPRKWAGLVLCSEQHRVAGVMWHHFRGESPQGGRGAFHIHTGMCAPHGARHLGGRTAERKAPLAPLTGGPESSARWHSGPMHSGRQGLGGGGWRWGRSPWNDPCPCCRKPWKLVPRPRQDRSSPGSFQTQRQELPWGLGLCRGGGGCAPITVRCGRLSHGIHSHRRPCVRAWPWEAETLVCGLLKPLSRLPTFWMSPQLLDFLLGTS